MMIRIFNLFDLNSLKIVLKIFFKFINFFDISINFNEFLSYSDNN